MFYALAAISIALAMFAPFCALVVTDLLDTWRW